MKIEAKCCANAGQIRETKILRFFLLFTFSHPIWYNFVYFMYSSWNSQIPQQNTFKQKTTRQCRVTSKHKQKMGILPLSAWHVRFFNKLLGRLSLWICDLIYFSRSNISKNVRHIDDALRPKNMSNG